MSSRKTCRHHPVRLSLSGCPGLPLPDSNLSVWLQPAAEKIQQNTSAKRFSHAHQTRGTRFTHCQTNLFGRGLRELALDRDSGGTGLTPTARIEKQNPAACSLSQPIPRKHSTKESTSRAQVNTLAPGTTPSKDFRIPESHLGVNEDLKTVPCCFYTEVPPQGIVRKSAQAFGRSVPQAGRAEGVP
jgi:hypothetical protein